MVGPGCTETWGVPAVAGGVGLADLAPSPQPLAAAARIRSGVRRRAAVDTLSD
jgi:hypothetical protein